jgi:hypothetical protein
MRITAHLFCLAASLVAAPAFAQGGRDSGPVSAAPQTLAQAPKQAIASTDRPSPSLNLGLGLSKGGTERTMLPVAPIQKDELALTWQPASKWGLSLDLTSRAQNDVLPREEVTAGVTYQVTPRFRFGGGVTVAGDSVAETLANPASSFANKKDGAEASVRIESAFSF